MESAAVIFDMDGVIIDSEPIHSRVKMDTFAHFGLEFAEADLERYMGRTSKAIFSDVLAASGRVDIKLSDIVAYKHQHYLEILRDGGIKPIAGTVELIQSLYESGIPLALASSSHDVVIDIVLEKFGISDCFSSVLSGGNLPASKPDPAIYRISAERLEIPPALCTVVEDTKNGVLAAKGAGMYCIGYRNPHSGSQDLSKADRIIEAMTELSPANLRR